MSILNFKLHQRQVWNQKKHSDRQVIGSFDFKEFKERERESASEEMWNSELAKLAPSGHWILVNWLSKCTGDDFDTGGPKNRSKGSTLTPKKLLVPTSGPFLLVRWKWIYQFNCHLILPKNWSTFAIELENSSVCVCVFAAKCIWHRQSNSAVKASESIFIWTKINVQLCNVFFV